MPSVAKATKGITNFSKQSYVNDLIRRINTQNCSFAPNCTCRDVVEVAVTNPAVGDMGEVADVYTTSFGVRKFVWFKMLKNSARNCSPSRSVKCELRVAEKSSSDSPGPVRASRETFP